MVLICLGTAWIAGIILGSFTAVPLFFASTGLLPLLVIPFIKKHRKILLLTGLCTIALIAGTWRYDAAQPPDDETSLRYYNDAGKIEIRGTVVTDPEQQSNSIHLWFQTEAIKLSDTWQAVSGTALVFAPLYSDYQYGDRLLVFGEPQTPQRLDDFDYETYLAAKGICSTLSYPAIEILERETGNPLLYILYTVRNSFADSIARVIPEPQASFVQAVLLGMRGGIPEPVRQAFSTTGTAHLLAISGLHLSIIAGLALTIGVKIFGRRYYLYIWLALALIWFYALLSGMNPPVIRAAIMVTLYLAAELVGRQKHSFSALVLAAAVMTAVTPRVLREASFQMSFAAMAGLIFIFPLIQSLYRKYIHSKLEQYKRTVTLLSYLADSLNISAGAVLAIWPITVYYFGSVSPVVLVATLFTLPALPFVIIAGLLCGLAGTVFLPLAQAIGSIALLLSSYIIMVVNAFAVIPPLHLAVNPIIVIMYYLCLAAVIWFAGKKLNDTEMEFPDDKPLSLSKKNLAVITLLIMAIITTLTAVTEPDRTLHAYFLDVGQGDAILFQKGSRQILIDGGPSPDAVLTELGRYMPFRDRSIDLVILTHPDADHLTGLVEIIKRYRVRNIVYSDIESDSRLYSAFLRLLEEKNIASATLVSGQQIIFDDEITLEILNPDSRDVIADFDDAGLVVRLRTGDISFLLTGDIGFGTEYNLISSRSLTACTVLKVAHHGSATSTSPAFLDIVRPEIAVISCGRDNRFGHPAPEVIRRLEKIGAFIYRTDIHGTVEFITDGTVLKVKK